MKNEHLKHSNKIGNHTAGVVAAMALSCLLLSACGQRGALFIPNTPEAAQRSTIGDVLTQPGGTTPTPQTPPASPTPTTLPTPAITPTTPAPAK